MGFGLLWYHDMTRELNSSNQINALRGRGRAHLCWPVDVLLLVVPSVTDITLSNLCLSNVKFEM